MFLPVNRQDMDLRSWHYLDFLLITPDAYVDHCSFAAAVISRYLEELGYRVGILAQPDLKDDTVWRSLGKPRYAVLVSGGNMDSMVCNYTSQKNPRKNDDYSPGGKKRRPDYASIAYAQKARAVFGKQMPVVIGGIEVSLRRFAHYDYWQDKVLPSALYAAGADLLVYGMGELATAELAAVLAAGGSVADCRKIAGLAYLLPGDADIEQAVGADRIFLPPLEEVAKDPKAFAKACVIEEKEQNFYDGKTLLQRHGDSIVAVNKPQWPLTTAELDAVYELPYERRWHPSYDKAGGVPAFDEVKFSLVSHRGCFGGCSFCAINFHQGRVIQSRSSQSILREAQLLTALPDFKGNIHDVGGPTANFRGQVCAKAMKKGPCRDKQCLNPKICPQLPLDSSEYERLLTDLRKLPGVKKVFVRSGLRFDYALAEKSRSFLHTLCRYHISGQLKIAPEHISPAVLRVMGKSGTQVYFDFLREYNKINRLIGKDQHLVAYFMSSHPGCTINEAVELAEYFHKMNFHPQQVQDFIPTPGTRSTCMYYTGLDPYTLNKIYVPKGEEKAMQRALLQYDLPENAELAAEALRLCGKQQLDTMRKAEKNRQAQSARLGGGKNEAVKPAGPKKAAGKSAALKKADGKKNAPAKARDGAVKNKRGGGK